MIDKIYIFLILGIYFILAFWYYIINSDGEHQFYFKGDYGKKYRANQLFRFVTLIVFTIINFLPTILNLQTNGVKLLAGLFSLSSLCYFFYEILIKNAKRDKYLVCLQNTSLDIVALESVFEIKENKADYILYGDDKTQLFYQATTENGPALITRKANVNTVLLPQYAMDADELDFICKQINIYVSDNRMLPKSIRIFKDKGVYKYVNEYLWSDRPYLKFFVEDKFKTKRKKLLKNIGYVVLGIAMAFIFLDWQMDGYLFKILGNWLFEKR